jgi:sec-independent protein translocase protein TatB
MPGFGDSAFIVILALLLFGPKKLPVLARQLGKLMADFRRASNEFRTQMEEELRISEQADRQKQIAALETPAAVTPSIESAVAADQAHEPPPPPSFASTSDSDSYDPSSDYPNGSTPEPAAELAPIATSGDLSIMPPSTGLPVAASSGINPDAVQPVAPPDSLLPPTQAESANTAPPAAHDPRPAHEAELETETLHG